MSRVARALPLLLLTIRPAWGDEDQPPPPPKITIDEERLKKLEQENRKLRDDVADLKDQQQALKEQVKSILPLTGKVSGYVDFGFFRVAGDGSGIRPDYGNVYFPEYAATIPGGSWVFMGDPLSTAINSRGEPSTTGPSRAITFDPVNDAGKSSFILNALNMSLFAGIGDDVTVTALFDLVPRSRNVSDPGLFLGDFVDVKLAYAEYIVPLKSWALSIYAGKIDSTVGYEYRVQESPDRLTVTPSLICRYLCGHPLGVKARAQFADGKITAAVAVTNGTNFVSMFPFSDEIDSNDMKTVSGRLSYKLPIGSGLQLGVSGAIGAQDQQSDDTIYQWHVGADLHLLTNLIDFSAEYVKGSAPGATEPGMPDCNLAPCLDYQGAYGLLGLRLNNWLIPYARVDWRDALHKNGANFIYISDLMRVTAGVRLELGTSVILKAEYTYNRELGRIPQFDDDVFTSSMVVKY